VLDAPNGDLAAPPLRQGYDLMPSMTYDDLSRPDILGTLAICNECGAVRRIGTLRQIDGSRADLYCARPVAGHQRPSTWGTSTSGMAPGCP
jgi:hypothetical protein